MQRPPILRTKEEVCAKLQMLEALADIEIAMNIIKEGSADMNPIDNHYNSLKCCLDPLANTHSDFKVLPHRQHQAYLALLQVFDIQTISLLILMM